MGCDPLSHTPTQGLHCCNSKRKISILSQQVLTGSGQVRIQQIQELQYIQKMEANHNYCQPPGNWTKCHHYHVFVDMVNIVESTRSINSIYSWERSCEFLQNKSIAISLNIFKSLGSPGNVVQIIQISSSQWPSPSFVSSN